MKLVIDIPEKYKDLLDKGEADGSIRKSILLAVSNGTPLPEGHGRLIDADILEECKEVMNTIMNKCEYAVRMDEVRNVPTIIEADKAERSE